MHINIDGKQYELTPETQMQLLQQLQAFEINAYQGLADELRFLLKPVARHLLSKTETKLRPTLGKEEAARICRPAKREDPVLHFLSLHMAMAQSMFNGAEFTIETDGSSITNCSITNAAEDQGGRSLAADGNERERENDGVKIS